MCPMYKWQDEKTGTEVEVLRKFDEYEVPPTQEEAPGLEEPKWRRLIGGKQQVVKGAGWGGKGYWQQVLTDWA